MARRLRVEYEGAVYHVTARGNERRRIFRADADRRLFLETLGEGARLSGLLIHGYCLMPNHYHLLLETPRGNLSRAMGWLQTTYTVRFNRRYRRVGHLFQGRFKAHVVEKDGYASSLLRYVHLNPVRPQDRRAEVPPKRWREFNQFAWSSHRSYAGLEKPPPWLSLEWLGLFDTNARGAQKEYREYIRSAFGRIVETPWDQLHGGLVLGGEGLWLKVTALLECGKNDSAVRWRRREKRREAPRESILDWIEREPDRRVQIWLRVVLGGARRIDVARELGYADGSAITQALKRIQGRRKVDEALDQLLGRYAERYASSVKG